MEQHSNALPITPSSPTGDGSAPSTWMVRSRTTSKPCAFCGKVFSPNRWTSVQGEERVIKEKSWHKQTCCGQSCAKKLANPMSKNQARLKMKATLRRIRHRPIKRGGNGQLLPLPQLALLHALGEGWESEVAVPTGMDRFSGYPTCYKIDLANKATKVGIEIDGGSHMTFERRDQDAKKMRFLATVGWSVYRVSNEEALRLYSTFTSTDTLLTSLAGGSSITAT